MLEVNSHNSFNVVLLLIIVTLYIECSHAPFFQQKKPYSLNYRNAICDSSPDAAGHNDSSVIHVFKFLLPTVNINRFIEVFIK